MSSEKLSQCCIAGYYMTPKAYTSNTDLEKGIPVCIRWGKETTLTNLQIMKTKPFDLNKALQGHPLVTDCGREASHFRKRFPYEDVDEFPYEAIIEGDAYPIDESGRIANENIYSWGGKRLREEENHVFIRRLYLKDCDWKPEPKIGDEILVKDKGSSVWTKSYFITLDSSGRVLTSEHKILEGEEDGEFCIWDQWKWPEEEKEVPEYTWEELKEKLGHEFKIKDK